MKKILLAILCVFLLIWCSKGSSDEQSELTSEVFMTKYTSDKRVVDLSSMWLSDFVSLNWLNWDTEIVNMNVSNNDIDVLNITDYPNLTRLVANNNSFTYFNDIKFPSQIKHINLANNDLESLEAIDNLIWLVSIDVSNNMLDEEDFNILNNMENLKVIYASWNNVSNEFLIKLFNFNARYLQEIKGANPTEY